MIIKSIVREMVRPSRVAMRDAPSCCAVLVENNNRKSLSRLHFNRAINYIGLFDGEKEERFIIETLDQIYDHTKRLRTTTRCYVEEKSHGRGTLSPRVRPRFKQGLFLLRNFPKGADGSPSA